MSVKNVIKSLNSFRTFNDEQLEILSSISSVYSYNKEYILHYEKKENGNLLFLIEGLAKAYKIDKHNNEIFLYYIYKNSLLSEISDIYNDTIRSFSNIELLEDSKILTIDYKLFKEYFINNNIFCLHFINEIILKSKQMQSLINREFLFDSVQKVAMTLDSDINMFNNFKRHDISLILHIQPATLSRVLNKLKRNKIIDIIHGEVTVLDYPALENIYKE
ncbi:MAG TPA: transcriptional regulator [Sulfurimonas sp. UBA12504]|nr:MAG: transcriptional regulator [Sulfurimonas sp. GWF2_37_8]DAB30377.1 MAG TPA: transcriptional regulator [Sulfurimonas sp. UBA12504]